MKRELRRLLNSYISALEELLGAWDALLFVLLFPLIVPTVLIWKWVNK